MENSKRTNSNSTSQTYNHFVSLIFVLKGARTTHLYSTTSRTSYIPVSCAFIGFVHFHNAETTLLECKMCKCYMFVMAPKHKDLSTHYALRVKIVAGRWTEVRQPWNYNEEKVWQKRVNDLIRRKVLKCLNKSWKSYFNCFSMFLCSQVEFTSTSPPTTLLQDSFVSCLRVTWLTMLV